MGLNCAGGFRPKSDRCLLSVQSVAGMRLCNGMVSFVF